MIMDYIIGALAVYKIVHVVDNLTPKEAMPWVKVLFSFVVSVLVAFALHIPNVYIAGCAVATLAGIVHAVLRLVMLLGDMTQRRYVR